MFIIVFCQTVLICISLLVYRWFGLGFLFQICLYSPGLICPTTVLFCSIVLNFRLASCWFLELIKFLLGKGAGGGLMWSHLVNSVCLVVFCSVVFFVSLSVPWRLCPFDSQLTSQLVCLLACMFGCFVWLLVGWLVECLAGWQVDSGGFVNLLVCWRICCV